MPGAGKTIFRAVAQRFCDDAAACARDAPSSAAPESRRYLGQANARTHAHALVIFMFVAELPPGCQCQCASVHGQVHIPINFKQSFVNCNKMNAFRVRAAVHVLVHYINIIPRK